MSLFFPKEGISLFILIVALACQTGCRVVGPDHLGVSAPSLQNTYADHGYGRDAQLPSDELARWWVHINDPILQELVAIAANQNLDIREASLRVMESRARVGIITGSYYPQAAASADYAFSKRSANGRSSGANVIGNSFDLFSIGLDTAWEIDLFGRIKRSVEAAEAEVGFETENLHSVQTILLADIAIAYTNARLAQELIRVQMETEEVRDKHLEQVKVRFEAGEIGRLDLTQAEAIKFATKAQLPALYEQLQLSLNRLSVLLGEVPSDILFRKLTPAPIPDPHAAIASGVPADLLRRRPDIRKAERQVAIASAEIGIAESDLYPRLTLLGTISLESRNLSSLLDTDSLAFGVGPSLRWNILQFGRIRCNIEAAKIRHQNAINNYRRTVLLACEEVENGLVSYHRNMEAAADLRQAAALASEAIDLADDQYEAGRVDFNRLIEAQRRLRDSQVRLASNRAAAVLSLIRTYKAAGGGWEAFGEACLIAHNDMPTQRQHEATRSDIEPLNQPSMQNDPQQKPSGPEAARRLREPETEPNSLVQEPAPLHLAPELRAVEPPFAETSQPDAWASSMQRTPVVELNSLVPPSSAEQNPGVVQFVEPFSHTPDAPPRTPTIERLPAY